MLLTVYVLHVISYINLHLHILNFVNPVRYKLQVLCKDFDDMLHLQDV